MRYLVFWNTIVKFRVCLSTYETKYLYIYGHLKGMQHRTQADSGVSNAVIISK